MDKPEEKEKEENKEEPSEKEAPKEEKKDEKTKETSESPKKSSKKSKKDDELSKVKNDLNALNDRYLRTLAEYENYRKRTSKELDARVATAKIDVIQELLPVIDNFERAAFNSGADFETYKKGVEMIEKQFSDIIKKLGVESYGEKGDEFDPNIHSAVMHEDSEDYKENEITEVFMKGYKLGDRIIRPATVKVAN